MANLTRRQWLKVGLAVGGMVTLSQCDVAKRAIDGLPNGTSGKQRAPGNAAFRRRRRKRTGSKTTTNHAMTQCRLLDTVRYPRPLLMLMAK
ncbi:hypothetical protein KCP70_23335 [Salmonella enterica subsp. enterica]|nr:hypothetical protein KCP70_23335 [Salmonella enterica subsp. enterica]